MACEADLALLEQLVERSLRVIEAVHGAGSFIPVRLNGLVHTTDRQALRSIARQLKCNGFDEEDGAWVRPAHPSPHFYTSDPVLFRTGL